MKGKSTISFIVVLVLVAAIIMLITRFDFNHMDGSDWTIVLIVVGVLLGIGALIINSITKNNEQGNTTSILTGKTNELLLFSVFFYFSAAAGLQSVAVRMVVEREKPE